MSVLRRGLSKLLSDPETGETVRRFAVILAMIVMIGALSSRAEPLALIAKLTLFNAALVALIAAVRRERLLGPALTRWDEALGYLAVGLGARMFGG